MSSDLDIVSTLLALRQQYGAAPSYQQLWAAIAAGCVPAERHGRSWRTREADLPAIAAHFGLGHPPAAARIADDESRARPAAESTKPAPLGVAERLGKLSRTLDEWEARHRRDIERRRSGRREGGE